MKRGWVLGVLSVAFAIVGDVAGLSGIAGLVNSVFDTSPDAGWTSAFFGTLFVLGTVAGLAAVVLGIAALVAGPLGPRLLGVAGILIALIPLLLLGFVWLDIPLPF